MDPRRDVLEAAVARGDAPFLVGMIADAGGLVFAGAAGMRRRGAQGWSELLNMQRWVDPRAGLAALLMTQTLPFMEPGFFATYAERAGYAA